MDIIIYNKHCNIPWKK